MFAHSFFFESSLTIFILANSSVHTNDPDMLSLVRLEPWTLRFSNTTCHYTHVHHFNKNNNELYHYNPLPHRWDQIPNLGDHLEFNDFTRIPFPLNSQAPHWPYIVRHCGDPTLPSPTDIVLISRADCHYTLTHSYASSLMVFTDRSQTHF